MAFRLAGAVPRPIVGHHRGDSQVDTPPTVLVFLREPRATAVDLEHGDVLDEALVAIVRYTTASYELMVATSGWNPVAATLVRRPIARRAVRTRCAF
jgi:hypothetical protein